MLVLISMSIVLFLLLLGPRTQLPILYIIQYKCLIIPKLIGEINRNIRIPIANIVSKQ